MDRYASQTILPSVGAEGQGTLAASSVLVVGAGGLGCPALLYLAGAGIGRIGILDADHVSIQNLHRQVLYRESDAGKGKAQVAARALRARNGSILVEPHAERLTSINSAKFVAAYDIVLDCADNYATTYALSDACLEAEKPLISASVIGMTGYIGVFCKDAPSYRAVFPEPPEADRACNDAGVLGPAAGIMGLWQAQETLKTLLGLGQPSTGRLLTFDFASNTMGGFDFSAASEPACVLHPPLIALADLSERDSLIDVRETDEVRARPLPGAIHIPLRELTLRHSELPIGKRLVLGCPSGFRAAKGVEALRGMGYCHFAILAAG